MLSVFYNSRFRSFDTSNVSGLYICCMNAWDVFASYQGKDGD